MSSVSVQATAVAPYAWPMDVYPGFVSVTGDFYSDEATADPNLLARTMPSVWSSSAVNYNVTFIGGVGVTVLGVDLVSLPPSEPGLIASRVNATTYNVSGGISAANGEFYNFLLRNNTYANLSPINTEDWIAIIRWNPASQPWEKQSTFVFEVEYEFLDESMIPTIVTSTINISQYQYWQWEPSLANLRSLVSQGET